MELKITNKENPTVTQFIKERGFTSKKSFLKVNAKGRNKVIANNLRTKREGITKKK